MASHHGDISLYIRVEREGVACLFSCETNTCPTDKGFLFTGLVFTIGSSSVARPGLEFQLSWLGLLSVLCPPSRALLLFSVCSLSLLMKFLTYLEMSLSQVHRIRIPGSRDISTFVSFDKGMGWSFLKPLSHFIQWYGWYLVISRLFQRTHQILQIYGAQCEVLKLVHNARWSSHRADTPVNSAFIGP